MSNLRCLVYRVEMRQKWTYRGETPGVILTIVRYSSAERMLRLVLMLSASRGGMTIMEIAQQLGVSRRTAERLRGKLEEVAGAQLMERADGAGKRWTLYSSAAEALAIPTMDELAELRIQATELRSRGHLVGAGRLESLALKVESVLSRDVVRRFEPDIEAMLDSTGWVWRPGPKLIANPDLIDRLRRAILECRVVQLVYRRRGDGALTRPLVSPYGVLLGSRGYLVGFKRDGGGEEPRLYALGNIEVATLQPESFVRDAGFDLKAFAARSFGVYWDGTRHEVEWRFSAKAADDAREYQFHPEQESTEEMDGSITVRFKASGLIEMAWHLFRWGREVTVVSPVELREVREKMAAEAFGDDR